ARTRVLRELRRDRSVPARRELRPGVWQDRLRQARFERKGLEARIAVTRERFEEPLVLREELVDPPLLEEGRVVDEPERDLAGSRVRIEGEVELRGDLLARIDELGREPRQLELRRRQVEDVQEDLEERRVTQVALGREGLDE